jgi:hypothetical protein
VISVPSVGDIGNGHSEICQTVSGKCSARSMCPTVSGRSGKKPQTASANLRATRIVPSSSGESGIEKRQTVSAKFAPAPLQREILTTQRALRARWEEKKSDA